MSAFVELIKKIGIFMIAAQVLVHLAPGQKYEKYIRMIVGVMILLQFLLPVYRVMEQSVSQKSSWNEQLFYMENEITSNGRAEEALEQIEEADFVADSVIKQMEEEIKSKLNDEMKGEDYRVINVRLTMREQESRSGDGKEQYELKGMHVVVRRTYSFDEKESQNSADGVYTIEKVQIQKIDIASDSQNRQKKTDETAEQIEETDLDEEQKKEKELVQRFCSVLGIEEEYMEVSVYGMADEDNR